MKWYDDIRDEMVILGLIGLAILGAMKGINELSILCAGGLLQFLKKEKKNGGGSNDKVSGPNISDSS